MIILSYVIPSIIILIFSINFYRTRKKYLDVKSKYDKILELEDSYYLATPGRRALVKDYGFVTVLSNKSFKVDFEVDILEVTKDSVKVSAYDFRSDDSFTKNITNRGNILAYFDNIWIPKNIVQVIIDDEGIRDKKLNQILGYKN